MQSNLIINLINFAFFVFGFCFSFYFVCRLKGFEYARDYLNSVRAFCDDILYKSRADSSKNSITNSKDNLITTKHFLKRQKLRRFFSSFSSFFK